jgi:hypothetical protein
MNPSFPSIRPPLPSCSARRSSPPIRTTESIDCSRAKRSGLPFSPRSNTGVPASGLPALFTATRPRKSGWIVSNWPFSSLPAVIVPVQPEGMTIPGCQLGALPPFGVTAASASSRVVVPAGSSLPAAPPTATTPGPLIHHAST